MALEEQVVNKLIEKNYGGSCIIEVYRNSYKEYEEIYNSYNLCRFVNDVLHIGKSE